MRPRSRTLAPIRLIAAAAVSLGFAACNPGDSASSKSQEEKPLGLRHYSGPPLAFHDILRLRELGLSEHDTMNEIVRRGVTQGLTQAEYGLLSAKGISGTIMAAIQNPNNILNDYAMELWRREVVTPRNGAQTTTNAPRTANASTNFNEQRIAAKQAEYRALVKQIEKERRLHMDTSLQRERLRRLAQEIRELGGSVPSPYSY